MLLSVMLFLTRVIVAGWLNIEAEAVLLWERWEANVMGASAIAEAGAEAPLSSSTRLSSSAALVVRGGVLLG